VAAIRFAYLNHLEDPVTYFANGPQITYSGGQLSASNGVASITRASGSFITDGVKKWALVGGTIASSFPANTRVSAVAALTLTTTANATGTASGVNGTLTPDLALNEDPAYPETNLTNKQRYIPWKTFSIPGGASYDLGSAKSCNCVAALAHQIMDPTVGGLYNVDIYSADTWGTWTFRGNIDMLNKRDGGDVFTTVSARYWKFPMASSGVFSLGGLFLGRTDLAGVGEDLGIQFGPGTAHATQQPSSTLLTPSGIPYEFMSPFDRRTWSMRWDALTPSNRQKIETVLKASRNTRTPVMFDESDVPWEIRFVDRRVAWTSVFNTVESMSLDIESLP